MPPATGGGEHSVERGRTRLTCRPGDDRLAGTGLEQGGDRAVGGQQHPIERIDVQGSRRIRGIPAGWRTGGSRADRICRHGSLVLRNPGDVCDAPNRGTHHPRRLAASSHGELVTISWRSAPGHRSSHRCGHLPTTTVTEDNWPGDQASAIPGTKDRSRAPPPVHQRHRHDGRDDDRGEHRQRGDHEEHPSPQR